MRWAVAIAIAALGVVLLYLGMVAPMVSLFRPPSGSGADAPATPPAVQSSQVAPAEGAEAISNPPAAVGVSSAPASASSGPSKAPPHRVSKSMRKAASRKLIAAVDGLGARLANCPDRYVERGFGSSPLDDQGSYFTVLVLDVATRDGRMEILDVSPGSNGAVSAALVACARERLRGQVLPAPSDRGSNRRQYPLFLGPALNESPDQR